MNRIHPKPGREFILALGMVLGLGLSPVAALPSRPAGGIGGSSGVSPVNRAIFAGDLDAANRLTGLGERYIEQHALADAEAAFRGALAIVEAALGPTDPRLADSMTALADVRSERRGFRGGESLLLKGACAPRPPAPQRQPHCAKGSPATRPPPPRAPGYRRADRLGV